MRLIRTLLVVLLGLGVSETTAAAQVPFAARADINAAAPVNQPIPADMDRDGDLDLVAFHTGSTPLVVWYENKPIWSGAQTVSAVLAEDILVADVDGDEDLDLVVARDITDDLVWYENLGGGASFASAVSVATVVGHVLAAADLDRDGDLDLVYGKNSDDDIFWAANGGDGSSWTEGNTVGSGGSSPWQLAVAADLDGDGDVDLAASHSITGGWVAWFENTGGGSFAALQSIGTGFDVIVGLLAADIDRDGDLDLASASNADAEVDWFENTAGDGSSWSNHSIATGTPAPTGLASTDLDLDGDVDLLVGIGSDTRIFQNTGNGSSWDTSASTGAAGSQEIAVADLDGDGDPDGVSASAASGIGWSRSLNLHRSAAFGAGLTTIDSAADLPSWVSAGDLDRDGDQDALLINVGATGGIRWRANTDGAGSFGPANLIATANHARVIRVGDIDRDGDPDLVTARTIGTPTVAWHENTAGDASAWTTRTISSSYPSAYHADIGDVDRDGDPDVIASSLADGNSSLAWFENTAGNGSAWSQHTIAATQDYPSDVRFADVDGDGDLDAFYCIAGFATIAWKENTAGDGSTWSDHIIENGLTTGAPNTVEPVDMDRDGDVDVVVASRLSNNSAWFENANGAGTSWTRHSLGSSAKLFWLRASDLDQDGDFDVVGSGEEADDLFEFENTAGDGSVFSVAAVGANLDQPFGLDAADLDGDGDDDLLAVGFASNEVVSLRNGGGQFALPTTGKDYQGMVDGRKLDVLLIDAAHRGRAGDSDAEIADFELRFDDELGNPLSSAKINALLSEVRFYLDNGNRTFEDGVDTPLVGAGPLTLQAGVEHFTPADGDANHQLAAGTAKAYFVVATLQPTASSALSKHFQVVHLTESSSQAEDRSNDLPLSLEAFPDTTSEVIEALPASGDSDGDGLSNVDEADVYQSDPLDLDTDADALEDGDEVNTHGTSPTEDDSDDDGLGDGEELTAYGTLPTDADSDDDGFCDGPYPVLGCAAGDNCPAISNAPQTNNDAFSAGDACQCGNVDGSGGITAADYDLARAAVVKPTGPPFDADFCDVNGDAACDVEDLAILDRVVNTQPAALLDACPGYRGQ